MKLLFSRNIFPELRRGRCKGEGSLRPKVRQKLGAVRNVTGERGGGGPCEWGGGGGGGWDDF